MKLFTKATSICGVAMALLFPTTMTHAGATGVGTQATPSAGAVISPGSTGCFPTGNVCWLSGDGSYTFSATGTVCQSTVPTVGLGTCTVTSSGTFVNIVCGTGSASSASGGTTLTLTGTTVGTVTLPGAIAYSIFFTGGVGVLIGDAGGGLFGGNSTLEGVVNIRAVPSTPSPGAAGLGPCTPTFTVTYAIVLVG